VFSPCLQSPCATMKRRLLPPDVGIVSSLFWRRLRAALTPLFALHAGVLEVDRAINDAVYGEGRSAADILDGKVRAPYLQTLFNQHSPSLVLN